MVRRTHCQRRWMAGRLTGPCPWARGCSVVGFTEFLPCSSSCPLSASPNYSAPSNQGATFRRRAILSEKVAIRLIPIYPADSGKTMHYASKAQWLQASWNCPRSAVPRARSCCGRAGDSPYPLCKQDRVQPAAQLVPNPSTSVR